MLVDESNHNNLAAESANQSCKRPNIELTTQQHSYIVTKFLGRGISSFVYRAHSLEGNSDQTFALKILKDKFRQNFDTEISVHERLAGHPNILKMIGHSDKGATLQIPHQNDQ